MGMVPPKPPVRKQGAVTSYKEDTRNKSKSDILKNEHPTNYSELERVMVDCPECGEVHQRNGDRIWCIDHKLIYTVRESDNPLLNRPPNPELDIWIKRP